MDSYLALAARGENAWWRYPVCLIMALLFAGLVLLVPATVLALMHLLPPGGAMRLLQPKNPVLFFLGIAASSTALILGMAFAAMVVHRKRPRDLVGQWRWRFFAWGVGLWTAVQGGASLIDLLIVPDGFHVSAGGGSASFAAVALIGLLIQTFSEEFVFRGYLTQGLLLAWKKPLPAAITSGLLFGAVHIANGIPQALNAVVVGTAFALIAIRTGGIAMSWGLHLANNYFGAVIVVSGNDVFAGSPGLIAQATPQLLWWDVFVAAAALLAVLWLIFRQTYFSAAPAA